MSVPVLWVGPPGVGKTATTIAKYPYTEVVLLSSMTEEDIAGLPYHTKGVEHRTKPPMFQRLETQATKHKKIALFLDEIDKARREVADTLLTLVASRKVGEWTLPANCDIVAAANPPEWSGGDGVSKAMQSRFSIRKFHPNVKAWCDWFRDKWSHDTHWAMAERIADKVSIGELPLLETSGSGWEWRLTCPRTIDLAFTGAVLASSEEEKKDIVHGLLTARTAATMLQTMQDAPQTPEQQVAYHVINRANATPNTKATPLRIP